MQDEIDAIRFAAEQGDAKAQSNLGLMYDAGSTFPRPLGDLAAARPALVPVNERLEAAAD